MTEIDFSGLEKKRKPTRKERARYKKWRAYLADSRLSHAEQVSRAIQFTKQGRDVGRDD